MSLISYIWDKKRLLLLYVMLMAFVSSVYYLNIPRDFVLNELFYINIVCFIMLIAYLIAGYCLKNSFYKKLYAAVKTSHDNLLNALPKGKSFEQKVYAELLQKLYEQQNSRLEELYEEKKENLEYITSWVHEIKTPIAASRLVIENGAEKPIEQVLESIKEELDKIEAQVEQVLYNSRADEFAKDYMISEVILEEIVKAVVKKHANTFINKKIKIDIENVDLEVISDRKWLFYIMDQLVVNSLKYTQAEGKITIRGMIKEKEKQLIIEDNGIGIRKEDIARVFDRGFTGHTGRQDYKATGMGLYLSRKLARKLGHDISIESIHGEYTKVTIHFPKLIDYFNVTKM
ncbi:MAG: two-component sensor histidine kinase [Clostridia bacterium]|jgi:signal transduction histidine kinase|nr:two-component sensor histidine kinase [Clostridia bacterium]